MSGVFAGKKRVLNTFQFISKHPVLKTYFSSCYNLPTEMSRYFTQNIKCQHEEEKSGD